MYGLAKIAASFEARRNKQYWQLLKRLYGGGEEAVNAIKDTGDNSIWHGTRAQYVPQIEEEGLKVGPFREFGKGTFFGDRHTASFYAKPQLIGEHGGHVNIMEDNKILKEKEEFEEYLRENPRSKYSISDGAYVRLAKPSELHGTKELYPHVSQAKVFDIKEENDLKKVAPSQTSKMSDHDDGIQRIKNSYLQRVRHGSDEQKHQVLDQLVRKERETQPDWIKEKWTPESYEEEVKDNIDYYKQLSTDPKEAKYRVRMRSLLRPVGDELAEKLMVPRNEYERHQLQTYGKLRGRRVFDRLGVPQRKEMFFDHTDIAPQLLRHEDSGHLVE